jgi:hypothetical protein
MVCERGSETTVVFEFIDDSLKLSTQDADRVGSFDAKAYNAAFDADNFNADSQFGEHDCLICFAG